MEVAYGWPDVGALLKTAGPDISTPGPSYRLDLAASGLFAADMLTVGARAPQFS